MEILVRHLKERTNNQVKMKKYFAVSDIHSFFIQVNDSLESSGFDKNNSDHLVIICGDAFDRGHDSVEVFNWMKDLHKQSRLIYIRGNHEDLLEDCVYDIRRRRSIGRHHISNGTVNTIADIVGCSEYDILSKTFDWSVFDTKINELLNFIRENSINYFQLGNTVFVHGWVPTTCDEDKKLIAHENWRSGNWVEARWDNGMEMFHFKIVPPDITTIVCGHWHTSFAWHNYEDVCPEWGELAKFDEYIKYNAESKSRIVALDACTAYSGKINCVVFDEDGIIVDKTYSI